MSELAPLLGESAPIQALREQIGRLSARGGTAERRPTVLIEGETGTGKGLVAGILHRMSPRAHNAFIDVNCAAIPETLLEAELFGFERGAFTDARRAKPGLFQVADRGTIFLDEVGLLPEPLQAKLLKVIEERAVRRLGSTQAEPIDVWIVSATNSDLLGAIRARRFREDLYHRLAILTLRLPPLRERGDDIQRLAEHFLARACAEYGLPPRTLTADARARLLEHSWPGNVRELANLMERVVLLSEASIVTAEALGLKKPPVASHSVAAGPTSAVSLDDARREHFQRVLNQTGWNISRAASILGIARNTLRSQIRKLGLGPGASEKLTAAAAAAGSPPPAFEPVSAPSPTISPAPTTLAVRWDRRRVTVMRADLLVTRNRDSLPDSSRQLDTLLDKVRSFGGQVEELNASTVIAVFGLEAIEDAPRRAAQAALAMRNAAAFARQRGLEDFDLKICLHTIPVLVARVDGRAYIDLEARHRTATVLAAIATTAEPGTILVSASTAAFLERRLELVPAGSGAGGDFPVYRLLGHERAGLGLWGAMSRLVGRHQELQLLESQWASLREGRGQVVALVGEPGVGKSRLIWEFTHSDRAREWRLLETAAVSHGAAAPYLPVIALLRAYFQIESRDDTERIRQKVGNSLRALDESLVESIPAFLTLLDVPVDDPRWTNASPSQRRQRTLNALKRLLLLESRLRPLVLVFEDVHWIDCESQAVLDSLVEVLPTSAIMLIVAYRPEYRHVWASRSFYTQIRVDPLPHDHAAELVGALLGEHPSLDRLNRMLVEWTGGNPFLLEESIRTLIEKDALAGPRGEYRLEKPIPSVEVPPTVEELLAARIDRLPQELRRLVQSAAAIGKDIPFAILETIAELPDDVLRGDLSRLQAAELLYETSVTPDLRYTFKHALTHEVAYRSLPDATRRALHARIVAAMEALHADRLAEHVETLAHHAVRGEVWDKALVYLRRAGTKAFARSANREAVECFDLALKALCNLAETRQLLERAIDLRFSLYHALFPLGRLERLVELLREAEAIALRIGDERRLGWVSRFMSQYFFVVGDNDRAIEAAARALRIADALRDRDLERETNFYRGVVYAALGQYGQAAEILAATISTLESESADAPARRRTTGLLLCYAYLVRCFGELGEFDAGICHGGQAIRVAEEADDAFGLTAVLFGLGTLYLRKGCYEVATPLLERGVALSETHGLENWIPATAASLGSAYTRSGRGGEGLAMLQRAVERAEGLGIMASYPLWLVYLSEGCLIIGRRQEALEHARRALAIASEHNERGHRAWSLRILGQLAATATPPDVQEARTAYLEAIAEGEELGMRPLLACCHRELSELLRQAGDEEGAERHVSTADTLGRELDAPRSRKRIA